MEPEEKETIEELLTALDEWVPTVLSQIYLWTYEKQIPDEVVNFYLAKTGFNCPDPRMFELADNPS